MPGRTLRIACAALWVLAHGPHARAQAALPFMIPAPRIVTNSFSLSFLQSTSSDWAQGPQNYLAASAAVRLRVDDSIGPVGVSNVITVDIGVRASGDSVSGATVRTSENEVFGETRWSLPSGWMIDPYVSASFRSPITESFRAGAAQERTGNLWDPVVSYESAGMQLLLGGQSATLLARAGVALKQTRARDNTLLTDDPFSEAVERYRAETGMELVADGAMQQDSSFTATSRFALFTTFREPDPFAIRWESELRYRIWKFVGATVSLQCTYDPFETTRVQFRQSAMLSFFIQ